MEYKKQHVVSQAFLKAWVDSDTPQGYEPYVWLISRDGKIKEKKSPKNILYETDFYTDMDKGGERDVELEKRLSQIEGKFNAIREKQLIQNLPLTNSDFYDLAVFVATSYARTKFNKDSQSDIWKDYMDLLIALNPDIKTTKLFEEVEKLKSQPMHFFLLNFLDAVLPQLLVMNLTIHYSSQNPGFVTSDNPVIWFDPAIYDPSQSPTFFGVGSPTLNIIMPLTPNLVISISHEYPEGYYPIENPGYIDAVNSMMVGFAEEVIVSSTEVVRDNWFENAT